MAAAETRYVREACLPLGLFDNLSIMFSRDSAAFSVLSFGRHVNDGAVGADELAMAGSSSRTSSGGGCV